MRLIIIFLFFTSLFACDTSSNINAYQEYKIAKKNYIKAVVDNNLKERVKNLQKVIKCGKFLGFDISEYKSELDKLTSHSPLKIESPYLKITSFNPITIKLSHKMKVKFWQLKKRYYYKIFDIYNAKSGLVVKRFGNIYLKMVQNSPKKVRLLLYSKTYFRIKYRTRGGVLRIWLPNKNVPSKIVYPINSNIYHKIPKGKIIVIDPGHGGKDPGGIGFYRIKEKNIVLPIAKFLKKELLNRGYRVYLTRENDKFITLKNRTKFANQKKADLFISIHCNIAHKHPEVFGIETYFLSPAKSERAKNVAKIENSAIGNLQDTTQNIILNFLNRNRIIASTKFALDVQKSLVFNLKKFYKGIKDGGVRPAPFWVLVGTNMPAILIETGFISNKKESLKLKNKLYQKRFAKSIADGIDNYFRKNP